MSTTTTNLGLFKYTEADYDQTFNFQTALNGNWDKIDTFAGQSGGGADDIAVISDTDGNLIVELCTASEASTIIIPEVIVDQVFDSSSTDAQSGVAISSILNTKADFSALSDKADLNIATIQDITTLENGNISLSDSCSIYKHIPSSATTYTFDTSNLTLSSNTAYTFELYINMTTAYTLTFPNSVSWQNNETPDFTSTGTYFFAFRTIDGGNTWLGNLQGRW